MRSALALPLDDIDLLVIENVGNLVCPAEFRVGEDARIMVSAVTEGEEKPAKYPLMFRACELVLINKIDLLPHLDFDLDKFLYHLDAVHPGVEHILVSAKTGEGLDEWREWLTRAGTPAAAARAPADAHARSGVLDRLLPSDAGERELLRRSPRASHSCATGWPSGFARGGRLVAVVRTPAARSTLGRGRGFVHP